MESINVGRIHPECAAERLADTQINLEEELEKAGHVKTVFSQEGQPTEHMWVEVILIDYEKRLVTGTLANDPRWLTNIKCDDPVTVPFATIEQVLEKEV